MKLWIHITSFVFSVLLLIAPYHSFAQTLPQKQEQSCCFANTTEKDSRCCCGGSDSDKKNQKKEDSKQQTMPCKGNCNAVHVSTSFSIVSILTANNSFSLSRLLNENIQNFSYQIPFFKSISAKIWQPPKIV